MLSGVLILGLSARVWTLEQIPQRLPPEQSSPASPLMLRSIMVHVAALAERREVLGRVVGRVVIAVARRQDHARGAYGAKDVVGSDGEADEATRSVTP